MTETETRAAAETTHWLAPRVDISELTDEYRLEAEMPGVAKEGLAVTIQDGELTLVGHRQRSDLPGTPLHREARPLDFRRSFDLSPDIDADRISARIEQGLVTVRLPKAEKAKPRRIEVN